MRYLQSADWWFSKLHVIICPLSEEITSGPSLSSVKHQVEEMGKALITQVCQRAWLQDDVQQNVQKLSCFMHLPLALLSL